MAKTPNIQTDSDLEHRSVDGIDAKAVFQYTLPVAQRIDTTVANTIYLGAAAIGTLTSASAWQIRKIDLTTGADITWANGNSAFTNVWDNRASLSYS